MATLLLRIQDLRAGDERRLEAALRGMTGVFGVVVSCAEGCAELDIEDDEVSVDRIVARVREEGYEARMV